MQFNDKKITEFTEKMAGAFLFQQEDTSKDKRAQSRNLDMRTQIVNYDLMRALIYYAELDAAYFNPSTDNSDADGIKTLIERLLISVNGRGRQDGVEVLRQQFAKKIEVETGIEKGLGDE